MTTPTPIPTPTPASITMPARIARLEEARLATALAAIAPESRPWLGGTLAAGAPGTWINMGVGAGMDPKHQSEPEPAPALACDIAEMCEFFESRGIEPRVEITPFVSQHLIAAIGDSGFRVRNFETILACDLATWREPEGWAMPQGLTIRRIGRAERSGDSASQLCTLMHTTMTGQPPGPNDLALLERVIAFDKAEVLIAEMNAEPAGIAMCDLFDEVAALYYGGTAERHRGKGIQAAMMVHRLRLIRDAGIPLATIGSLPNAATERNAIRVGMTVAYTKAIFTRPGPALAGNLF